MCIAYLSLPPHLFSAPVTTPDPHVAIVENNTVPFALWGRGGGSFVSAPGRGGD